MLHGEHMGSRRKRGLPSKAKAKEMMRHGEVRGKPLTGLQKGFMGLIAGGGIPTRLRKRRIRTGGSKA